MFQNKFPFRGSFTSFNRFHERTPLNQTRKHFLFIGKINGKQNRNLKVIYVLL